MKQTFLTLAFIFSLSVCFSQTNKNLFLDMRLSTDTIYASNDIFTISAQIKNTGFFPQKLYTSGCISENVTMMEKCISLLRKMERNIDTMNL